MIGQVFKYDGYDLSKLLVIEREIRRPLLNVNVLWNDSMQVLDVKNARRSIDVDVALVKKSKDELRLAEMEIVQALKKDGLKKITLDDYPDYHNLAILDGQTNFERFFRVGQSTLSFVTPDDFLRRNAETKQSFSTKSFTVNYAGTKEIQPIMIISGLMSDTKITIKHKDGVFELFNLPATLNGSFFEVNHETGEILFAGNLPSNQYHHLRSRWITLYPGANVFTVTAAAALTIEFIYNERMLR